MMDLKVGWKRLAWIVAGFLACFYLPVGHAQSLPSMPVLNSIIGFKKTLAYVALVVVMAAVTGLGG